MNQVNSISPQSGSKLVFAGTHWVYFDGVRKFMTLPSGSEGNVAAWSAVIDKTSFLTGYVINDVIWDPGAPGKTGLGVVLFGHSLATGAGVVFTAPDENLDFTLSETLSTTRSRIVKGASKYLEVLT